MMTTTDLLTQHAEAIAARESAKTAGVRAGATRRIAAIELELVIAGVEFTPWTAPRKATTRKAAMSDAELVDRLNEVRKVSENPTVHDRIRGTASALLTKLITEAEGRGLKVAPATPVKPKRTKRTVAA